MIAGRKCYKDKSKDTIIAHTRCCITLIIFNLFCERNAYKIEYITIRASITETVPTFQPSARNKSIAKRNILD